MPLGKKDLSLFLDTEMTDKEMIKLASDYEPKEGSSLRIDLQVELHACATKPPRNIWGIQTNAKAQNKALSRSNGRKGKGSKGTTKSMDVEAQIEITEDANQYLTPKLLRDAFRMSIPDIGKGVHKVLIDEEWIEAEDKDGKKIEVLAAVARVYPSAVWVLNNPDDIQEFLTTKNPAPRLNRATPQTASKARDAKKAGKK